jgi:hypothetical protein
MTDTFNQALEQAYIEALTGLAGGKSREETAASLIGKGWSPEMAEQIVGQAYRAKKTEFRKAGFKAFCIGLALLVLGIAITAASYSAAKSGGTYLVTIGLFLSGAINTVRGFFRMLVG